MSAEIPMLRPFGSNRAWNLAPGKKGAEERSEAEAMIQRYLELASHLLEDEQPSPGVEQICA